MGGHFVPRFQSGKISGRDGRREISWNNRVL